MCKTIEDKGWSLNLKKALNTIEKNYVLYLQEDYLLCRPVNEIFLADILVMMQENPRIAYCQTIADKRWQGHNNPLVRKITSDLKIRGALTPSLASYLAVKNGEKLCRNSLQSALWQKKALVNLMRDHENPWQFETNGTKRSVTLEKESGSLFLVVRQDAMTYLNAITEGKLEMGVMHFMKNKKLPLPEDFKIRHKRYRRMSCEYQASLIMLKCIFSKGEKIFPNTV